MNPKEKMVGKKRRAYLIDYLKQATSPVSGQVLADKTGVSRQVIVTDVALLRTSDEPIMATSRGYIYQQSVQQEALYRKVIVCKHTPKETKEELEAIVDCGVTVVNVMVEHPFYGGLTGTLMIDSRYEVGKFLENLSNPEGELLSILTGGVHLHTLEADEMAKIDAACEALKEVGILVTEQTDE